MRTLSQIEGVLLAFHHHKILQPRGRGLGGWEGGGGGGGGGGGDGRRGRVEREGRGSKLSVSSLKILAWCNAIISKFQMGWIHTHSSTLIMATPFPTRLLSAQPNTVREVQSWVCRMPDTNLAGNPA